MLIEHHYSEIFLHCTLDSPLSNLYFNHRIPQPNNFVNIILCDKILTIENKKATCKTDRF